jgi:DHA1 family bicyclomycin/chloramphenicol resistance-like MFS transporter
VPLGDRQAVRASLCFLAKLAGRRPAGQAPPGGEGGGVRAEQNRAPPGSGEFVARVALMISLVALSIDAMLPALPAIGAELGVRHANDVQLVISALFLGLAIAQMIYGPLSDSFGRKPAIYAGFAIFIAGCVLSILARGLEMMLLGRFLQGIGAAGPRIVTMALVRDQYAGRAMARVMSLAMAVFIMVPVLAPAIGQGIMLVAHWRAIFVMLLAVALFALTWFALRQPETLPPARRKPFSLRGVAAGVRETFSHRAAFGYTMMAGLIFGSFVGYLISAPQIFLRQYHTGGRFALYFGLLAACIGAAMLVNSRLVMVWGMQLLCRIALITACGVSLMFLGWAWALAGHPPFWALMIYLGVAFFCNGILFGNFNAMALEPLGHIAGVASAVVGSLTTFISLALGTLIGRSFDGTVLPLVGGFAGLGIAALAAMWWAEAPTRDATRSG